MNRYINQVLLAIFDVIVVNAAIFVAYFVRFSWAIPQAYMNAYYKSFIPISLIMVIFFGFNA